MQNRRLLKSGQHYTKYFDRLNLQPAIEVSCKRPTLFSDFAINNAALYNPLFTVEAVFQRDMQITKEQDFIFCESYIYIQTLHRIVFTIAYRITCFSR